jgi:hypothetical protein
MGVFKTPVLKFKIWDEIRCTVYESLKHASEMQNQQKKEELNYLAFSL